MALYYPGEMIADRYRVERELGEGGFGSVYEATELGVERRVAIKVLKPDDGRDYRPSTKARFQREAQAVGKLQSPHTVTLLDFGESEGKLFMVFELVPGEDLRTIINREGRLDPKDAVHILRQLLDSLGEAHRAGILHRDIKPANIRVFPWGDNPMFVKLLDFGLARPTDDGSPGITKTGEMIGTPRYMSPEQLRSEPLTPASDVYSLGIVFLEMLIGAAPLQGNRWADQFDRLMSGHIFSFPELQRIGPELVAVIHGMTALRASERFAGVTAVSRALSADANRRLASPSLVPQRRSHRWLFVAFAAAIGVSLMFVFLGSGHDDPVDGRAPEVGGAAPNVEPPEPRSTAWESASLARAIEAGQRERAFGVLVADLNAAGQSVGCSAETPPEASEGVYIPSSTKPGNPRPLVIFMPRDEDVPAAKVFGAQNEAEKHRAEARVQASSRWRFFHGTQLPELAEKHNFFVIIPAARKDWAIGKDELGVRIIHNDFLRFANQACVDLSRVYVIGDFMGGYTALRLANEPWVTAVALHAPALNQESWNHLPQAETSLLWIAPVDSQYVPFDKPSACMRKWSPPTFRDVFDKLRTTNNCTRSSTNSSTAASCVDWACDGSTRFRVCEREGGYDWSDSLSVSNDARCNEPEPTRFPVGDAIWEFFAEVPPRPITVD